MLISISDFVVLQGVVLWQHPQAGAEYGDVLLVGHLD